MKQKIIILAAFINIGFYSIAQFELSCSIKDSISANYIKFASVSIKNKNIGTYSNSFGRFVLTKLSDLDTIIVRHICYKTKYIPVSKVKANQIIFVKPYIRQINEVVVKPTIYDEKLIWSIKSRSKSTFSGFNGFELGTFIKDLPNKSIIKEIIIKTKVERNIEGEYYIKLHLYNVKQEQPSEEIRLSNNIFLINSKTRDINIDVVNENIMLLSSKIFVSIEWVGKKKNKSIDKSVKANIFPKVIVIRKKTSKTLYRFWNKAWQDFSDLLHIKNSNISIGLNLIIPK